MHEEVKRREHFGLVQEKKEKDSRAVAGRDAKSSRNKGRGKAEN